MEKKIREEKKNETREKKYRYVKQNLLKVVYVFIFTDFITLRFIGSGLKLLLVEYRLEQSRGK